MKKTYDSPEFELVRFTIENVICASAEIPIDDIIEIDGDDDV